MARRPGRGHAVIVAGHEFELQRVGLAGRGLAHGWPAQVYSEVCRMQRRVQFSVTDVATQSDVVSHTEMFRVLLQLPAITDIAVQVKGDRPGCWQPSPGFHELQKTPIGAYVTTENKTQWARTAPGFRYR